MLRSWLPPFRRRVIQPSIHFVRIFVDGTQIAGCPNLIFQPYSDHATSQARSSKQYTFAILNAILEDEARSTTAAYRLPMPGCKPET
jgi:hypothetical protein